MSVEAPAGLEGSQCSDGCNRFAQIKWLCGPPQEPGHVCLTYRNNKDPLCACVGPTVLFAVAYFPSFSLSSCSAVNTDTETAVVNVTYATKEEAKV